MTSHQSPSGPEMVDFAAKFPERLRPPFASYAAVQVWA